MKRIIAALATFLSVAAGAQTDTAPPVEDLTVANTLLECAAAQAQEIFFLEAAKADIGDRYKNLGFFLLSGEAFSSKQHAQEKYGALRQEMSAKADQVASTKGQEFLEGARVVLGEIEQKAGECTVFVRAHKVRIMERLKNSGLLRHQ